MGTFKRYTGGLGAITGERLEYRLSPQLYRALLNDTPETKGVCFSDSYQIVARLVALKDRIGPQRGYENPYDTMIRLGIIKLEKQLKKDHDWLTAHGTPLRRTDGRIIEYDGQPLIEPKIKGMIPVCLYQTNKDFDRPSRQGTVAHERLHARVVRLFQSHVYQGNVLPSAMHAITERALTGALRRLLPEADVSAVMEVSARRWAAQSGVSAEEVFARAEEIFQGCYAGKATEKKCAATKQRLAAYGSDIPRIVEKLTRNAVDKYGSVVGVVADAAKRERAAK